MSADKGPVDHLLDLLVFGPVGFASEARQLIPRLAEKGREQVDVQVRVARMIGQFAVQKGQQEAVKAVHRLRQPAPAPADVGPSKPASAPGSSSTEPLEEIIVVRVEDPDPMVSSTADVEVVDVGDLAIPAYDDLAASQVLPRLEGLRPGELDAVRRYEASHRHRKTVLGKIAQLQSSAVRPPRRAGR